MYTRQPEPPLPHAHEDWNSLVSTKLFGIKWKWNWNFYCAPHTTLANVNTIRCTAHGLVYYQQKLIYIIYNIVKTIYSPCGHDLCTVDNQFPGRDFNWPCNVSETVSHQCFPGRERCVRIAVQTLGTLQTSTATWWGAWQWWRWRRSTQLIHVLLLPFAAAANAITMEQPAVVLLLPFWLLMPLKWVACCLFCFFFHWLVLLYLFLSHRSNSITPKIFLIIFRSKNDKKSLRGFAIWIFIKVRCACTTNLIYSGHTRRWYCEQEPVNTAPSDDTSK